MREKMGIRGISKVTLIKGLLALLLLSASVAPLAGIAPNRGNEQNTLAAEDTGVVGQSETLGLSLRTSAILQTATSVVSKGITLGSLNTGYSTTKYDLKKVPIAYRSGESAQPLTNGVTVTGTLNASGDSETWYIDVSGGAMQMRSVLTCPYDSFNSVNFDLYGKLGAYPTTSSYDWIGNNWGSDDVSYFSPTAGRWYIMPYSSSGKGTYLLTVTILYTSSAQPLTSGTTVTDSLNATADSDLWYIDVDSDATSMRSVLTCPVNADFDLYGNLASYPTTDNYTWRSNVCGGENFTYDHPGAGRWYIMAYSYLGNGTYQLTVTITYPPAVQSLSSGVTVTGSLNVSGDYDLWHIYVNSGATMMHAVLSCPSGANFDLYGMFGSYPTTSYYNWRGVTNGSEDVTYSSPSSGSWYVMVTSPSGNGTYQLTVTVTYKPKIGTLTSGSTVIGSLNSAGASDMWYIYVSGGALRIHSVLTCPNGANFYLYGQYQSYPNTTYYAWAGTASSGQDVTYNYPNAGNWYILVYAFNGSGTYQLTVTATGPPSSHYLTSGWTLMGSLDGPGSYDIWYIDVPVGATNMRSVLTCPNFADFDIYGQYRSYPNTTYYAWAGTVAGDENVVYTYPNAGYWYIMVHDSSGTGRYEITVTINFSSGGGGGGGGGGSGGVPTDLTVIASILAIVIVLLFCSVLAVAATDKRRTQGYSRSESTYRQAEVPARETVIQEERRGHIPATRNVQCRRCGASLKAGDDFCWNCGAAAKAGLAASPVPRRRTGGRIRSGICMVCKRGLENADEMLFCPHCGSLAHRDHLLEWLHVKNYCPTCGRHLDEATVRKQTEPR